jgi:hypothetical protein
VTTTNADEKPEVIMGHPGLGAASSSTLGDDDNADEEPEVIMGHPSLGAPEQVFIPTIVDTTLFALHEVRDVLQWERRGLDEERQCLMEWGSLLKK